MIDSHFLHRCTIGRASRVEDAYGNVSETWSDVETNVPCRFVEKSMALEQNERAENAVVKQPMLLLGAGVDIAERDRISGLTLEDGTVLTRVWHVESLLVRRAYAAHHQTALLKVVQ